MSEVTPAYLPVFMVASVQCDQVFHCHNTVIPCERDLHHEGKHFGRVQGDEGYADMSWGEYHYNTDEVIPF